jgi:hypothetical protein
MFGFNVLGNDLVILATLLFCLGKYLFSSKVIVRPLFADFDNAKLAMWLYFGVAVMMAYRDSSYANEAGRSGLFTLFIRRVPYYATFFAVPAFVSNYNDLLKFVKVFIIVSFIGNIIIISQSFYGPGDMFRGLFISDIMSPPGPQIKMNVGGLYRSNFAIYFACVWCFFYYLSKLFVKFTLIDFVAVFFFQFAFLLNMARGLYLGIILAVLVVIYLNTRKDKKLPKSVFVIPVVIVVIFLSLPYLGYEKLWESMMYRFRTGLLDFGSGTGTWGKRLGQLSGISRLNFDFTSIAFGFGYNALSAKTGLPFIEIGPIDLIYRSGVVGTVILATVIVLVIRYSLQNFRSTHDLFIGSISLAIVCSIISEIGHLPSANHFYYHFYASVIGFGIGLVYVAKRLDKT